MKFPERQRSSDIKRNSQNHLFAFNWLVSAFRLVKKIFYHFITVIDVWVIFQMCRGFSFSLHPLKAWDFRCDISFYERRVNFQTKAKSNNRLTFIFEGGFVEQSCGFLRQVNAVSALLIFSSHRGKGKKSPLFPFLWTTLGYSEPKTSIIPAAMSDFMSRY